jgi:hypothetical protein
VQADRWAVQEARPLVASEAVALEVVLVLVLVALEEAQVDR